MLADEDKNHLANIDDFHILMQILLDKKSLDSSKQRAALEILDLLFPTYTVQFTSDALIFTSKTEDGVMGFINAGNFSQFQSLLSEMFCSKMLSGTSSGQQYNVKGKMAKRIAEKLKNRSKQLAKLKPTMSNRGVTVLSRYLSILTVGTQKDMNSFMNYTVYQLLDEFTRYKLKLEHDLVFQAKCAGASSKDIKEPEDWMKDLQEPSKN